jgi:hypothetical protein
MNQDLLIKLFATDSELLSKYHILAPNSAEVCAERTFNDLQESKVQVHLIEQNGEVIGYYGIEGTAFLTGFFLTPENRTPAMIELFWRRVEKHFDKDYFVGLYTKNTRAINFMNKKTTEKYETKNDVVLFKVRR